MKKENMFTLLRCDFLKPINKLVFMGGSSKPPEQSSAADSQEITPPPDNATKPQGIGGYLRQKMEAAKGLLKQGAGVVAKLDAIDKLNRAEQAAQTLEGTRDYLGGFDIRKPEVKKLVDAAIGQINAIEVGTDSPQNKANDRAEVLYNLLAKAEALTKIPKDLALLELAAAKKAFDRGVVGSDVRLEMAQQAVDKITEEEAMDQPVTPKKGPEKKELTPDQKYAKMKQLLEKSGEFHGMTMYGLTQLLVKHGGLKETDHKPASFVTAVENLQRKIGATADGIFGPATFRKLEAAKLIPAQDKALLSKDVDSIAPEKQREMKEVAKAGNIYVVGEKGIPGHEEGDIVYVLKRETFSRNTEKAVSPDKILRMNADVDRLGRGDTVLKVDGGTTELGKISVIDKLGDLHTISSGLAEATGADVSQDIGYFKGLVEKLTQVERKASDKATILTLDLHDKGDGHYEAGASRIFTGVDMHHLIRFDQLGPDDECAYKGSVGGLVNQFQKKYFDPKYQRQQSAGLSALDDAQSK